MFTGEITFSPESSSNPLLYLQTWICINKKVEFLFASVVLVHLFEVNARVLMKDELIRAKKNLSSHLVLIIFPQCYKQSHGSV